MRSQAAPVNDRSARGSKSHFSTGQRPFQTMLGLRAATCPRAGRRLNILLRARALRSKIELALLA
eukprot:2614130-Prymnesium_polylepis.1